MVTLFKNNTTSDILLDISLSYVWTSTAESSVEKILGQDYQIIRSGQGRLTNSIMESNGVIGTELFFSVQTVFKIIFTRNVRNIR